jgi:hypothetical protein
MSPWYPAPLIIFTCRAIGQGLRETICVGGFEIVDLGGDPIADSSSGSRSRPEAARSIGDHHGSRNLTQIVSHVILQIYETAAKPVQRRHRDGAGLIARARRISNAKKAPRRALPGRENYELVDHRHCKPNFSCPARRMIVVNSILLTDWHPLDHRPAPDYGPACWDGPHVGKRLADGLRTLMLMPRVRGPQAFGNDWP